MSSLPEGGPAWLTGAFFVLTLAGLVATKLAETSEAFAKLLGPIGRHIRTRADRKIERQRAARIEADASTDARVTSLTAQVEHLKDQLDSLVELDEYVVYVITWVRTLRVWAAENDVRFPPPELLTFEEWRPVHVYHGGIAQRP